MFTSIHYTLRCWLCIGGLLITQAFASGNEPGTAVGARSASLGQAYTSVRGDFWSLFHNPAGITGTEAFSLGAYVERRFLLTELTYGYAGAVLPFADNQAAGISVGSFGFSAYRSNHAALTYGITVLDKISIGARANYTSLNIQDYGGTSSFYVDVGVHTQVTKSVSVAFTVYNANRASLESQNGVEIIPTVLSAGLAYQPTEKVTILADVQKDIDHPLSFRGGIEYEIVPALHARVGMSTEPLTLTAGLGVNWKQFQLDLAFAYHEQLGYTPHFSLTYQLEKR